MINIRRKTFETNSSSSHSISIIDPTLVESELNLVDPWEVDYYDEDLDYNKKYVLIDFHEYCSYDDHESQEDRLTLCIQQLVAELHLDFWCVSNEEWHKNIKLLYEDEKFKEISDRVADYVGGDCAGVRIREFSEGYIDHDSDYGSYDNFMSHNCLDLVDFVFAKEAQAHFEFCVNFTGRNKMKVKNKKKEVYYILWYVFHFLTMFFIGGALGSLIGAAIKECELSIYGYICGFGAFPAAVVRAIFNRLHEDEPYYTIKEEKIKVEKLANNETDQKEDL